MEKVHFLCLREKKIYILKEGGKKIIRAGFLQHHFTVDQIWVKGSLGCQRNLAISGISVRHLTSCLICNTRYPTKSCCTDHAQKIKLLTGIVGRKYIKAEDNFFVVCFYSPILPRVFYRFLRYCLVLVGIWCLENTSPTDITENTDMASIYICHIIVLSFLEQELPLKLCQDLIYKHLIYISVVLILAF